MTNVGSDDQKHPNKKGRIAEYVGSADFWTALATISLVIVGIVAAYITNQTLELSERAWVAAVGGQVIKIPEKTKGIHISLSFQNTGREPATAAHIRIQNYTIAAYEPEFTDVTNVKIPENNSCEGNLPIKGRGVAPPNALYAFSYDTLRGEPALLADDGIINGTKFLVLNGCITYITFEKPHHTSFCYIVESSEPKSGPPTNLTIVLSQNNAPAQQLAVPTTQAVASSQTEKPSRVFQIINCATGFDID